MADTEIKQGYMVGDQVFATKAEAQNFVRRPKILAALNELTGNQTDLSNFLLSNQDEIEGIFEVGTIQRVSKSERNKLTKALEHAASLNDSKLAFLVENSEAIINSFRWPKVARMDEAAKVAAQTEQLTALAQGNGEVASYILANREGIETAYQAGVEKRQVNPNAANALAEYRARKAAEKAAAEGQAPAGAQ
jgi:hypothetical protein